MRLNKKVLFLTLLFAALLALSFVLLARLILTSPAQAQKLLLLFIFCFILLAVPSYVALDRLALRKTKPAAELEPRLLVNERLVFLGRVAANISHEINNPLFAIAFSFQLLKRYLPVDNSRVAEAARVLEREIERVRVLTRSMHTFVSRSSDEAELSDISAIIAAAVEVVKWSKKLDNTTIVYKQQGRSFPLRCHAGSLQQVFLNLAINAVEAMAGSGKLVIDVAETDHAYSIDFIDNGPGIKDEIKAEVFQAFKTAKPNHGAGLGLNICRHIVANHGGTINLVESRRQGAHFNITLPRNRRCEQ